MKGHLASWTSDFPFMVHFDAGLGRMDHCWRFVRKGELYLLTFFKKSIPAFSKPKTYHIRSIIHVV